MNEVEIPDEAAAPLAAFLLGKSLAPEYPHGGDVTVIARELLAKCAPLIVAAELERQADVVQGWREDGDTAPDFRDFRDHLRSRAAELRAAGGESGR
ncbi:MAG TPA: hypothetical protein VFQ42_08925 [Mycobacterium sp.]|nr:hypothetical protein [Mycobacterium sp.]